MGQKFQVHYLYNKIETLYGKNPYEIHSAVHEDCGESAVNHSAVMVGVSLLRETLKMIHVEVH